MRFFQYRNKSGTRRAIYETSLRLADLLMRAGALFLVNDHPDIAMAVHADGVHLGQADLPLEQARRLLGSGKIIGISTHTIEQARAAQTAGADYIGFGPIFPTTTKDAGPLQGLERLRAIRSVVTIPVIAIGGINEKNVGEVLRAGADGAAVISAILSVPDLHGAARAMIDHIQKAMDSENLS